jgi:pyruvate kinase
MMRRLPAKEKNIKTINEEDFRVSVLGIVVDRDENSSSLMIDDGTSRAIVYCSDPDQFSKAEEGKRVRIIGRVTMEDKEVTIEAEVIQDMSNLDMGLYEQVRQVSEKLRGE